MWWAELLNTVLGSFSTGALPIPPGSYESIASATPSGTGTVTFNSIPSTYKHLQIRFSVLTSGSGQPVYIRMNNISTSTYRMHDIRGNGSAASAGSNQDSGWLTEYSNGCDPTNPFVAICDIQDYTSTTANKVIRSFSGIDENGSGQVWLSSGLLVDTTAISRLDLLILGGGQTFATGSTISLYGIKG